MREIKGPASLVSPRLLAGLPLAFALDRLDALGGSDADGALLVRVDAGEVPLALADALDFYRNGVDRLIETVKAVVDLLGQRRDAG